MRKIYEVPAKREKTLQAGIGVNDPTAKARTSAKLASVIEGPTSAKASPTRVSSGKFRSCRFKAFTKIHMLSTPTCHHKNRMLHLQLMLRRLQFIVKEMQPRNFTHMHTRKKKKRKVVVPYRKNKERYNFHDNQC